jgi:hypothetical protein
MNAKQLLLGLSILAPVGAYGAAHSPFPQDTIKIPSHLCQDPTLIDGYRKAINRDMGICYLIQYWEDQGLVFVQVDTLQGPIFGFGGTTLYHYQNLSVDAYKDLLKNLNGQYQGELSIDRYFDAPKLPIRLNP